MATIKMKTSDDYLAKLAVLESNADEVIKKAIHDGAGVVADGIKTKIPTIPDVHRYILNDLEKSFGITPISKDREGDWNAKIGFDGYGSHPTKKYPKGLPNQMMARAIESGTSFRKKHPFVRTTVTRMRKPCLEAMKNRIDIETEKVMEK